MNEDAQVAEHASPLSSETFEDLLVRASLNSHFVRPVNDERRRELVHGDTSPIGETAGVVWQALAQRGPTTFATLIDAIGVTESLFYMAVGWLAREGKLEIAPNDGDYEIRLR